MDKTLGAHPSFPRRTTTTTSLFPPTPNNHALHLHQRPLHRNHSLDTSLETTPLLTDHAQTLEAAFARLTFSPFNHPDSYSNSIQTPLTHYPLRFQEIGQNTDTLSLQYSGLQDYGRYERRSDVVPDFHQMPHNTTETHSNQIGFLRVPRNMPLASASNQNDELSPVWIGDSPLAGNSNILRNGLQEHFMNCLCFENIRGRIMSMAKDQYGCRFLQSVMQETKIQQIDMIFLEVIDHVCELMLDQFGNYVFQKLVEVCSEQQRTQILLVLTNIDYQLVTICLNSHGTRAVQKLLENLTTQQQISLVMPALSPGAVALTKDMNGHRVIQHCLKHFSDEDNKYLLKKVADNCYGVATDKSGCCVLQQCVEYSKGEPRRRLISEITDNALHLAEDRFGNYVVQHLLGLGIPEVTSNILKQFQGRYVSLSCNKYGSNVVEKCLRITGEDHSTQIIMELLGSPNVSLLLLHAYGNYVIQTALSVSKGSVHDALLDLVHIFCPMMRSHLYGKRVLSWFDRR